VLVLELDVVAGGIAEEAALLVGQRARLLHRAADIEVARLERLARWHQAAGADDHLVLDYHAVHHDRAHAHQNAVAQGAAVQRDLVPDRDLVADGQREAVRVVRPGMGDVQHAAVLDARARTDADAVHVAADHRERPHRAVGADFHIADDHGGVVDEHALAQCRSAVLVAAYRHVRNLFGCGKGRL